MDGVATLGPNKTYEGGDSRTFFFTCGADGKYNFKLVNGLPDFPMCLPRRKLTYKL